MSTTDPAITIAGMRAEIDALTSALRSSNAALASASTSAACRDATLARCDTERDALATALATRTAERDEALSALAHAAAKHGEELARVEGARATAVGLASDYKTRAEQLAAKVNAITSERDSALANLRACEARVGAAPTTPPAEVFAGVSVEELIDTHEEAYSATYDERIKAIRDSGERPARMPSRPEIAIRAVLARLKVSLVAPVDPEEVAQELAVRSGSPGTRPYTDATIRAALLAAGVPVTPERGQ